MDTILVTGGSGRIGSAILEHLADREYRTVNVDVTPGSGVAEDYVEVDLTDAGAVYNAFDRVDPDGVAHMGAIPNSGSHPDQAVYESNAMGTFHVLQAARAFEVEALVLASSIQAMGSVVPPEPMSVEYLPMDEAHPQTPQDCYALGKQTIEILADGFARQPGAPRTISSFRLPVVMRDEEIRESLPADDGTVEHLEESGRDVLFAYVAVGDVADLVTRALEASFDGHERFVVSAPDTRSAVATEAIVETCYPDAEVRQSLTGDDPLLDVQKARDTLGWEPRTSWRTV